MIFNPNSPTDLSPTDFMPFEELYSNSLNENVSRERVGCFSFTEDSTKDLNACIQTVAQEHLGPSLQDQHHFSQRSILPQQPVVVQVSPQTVVPHLKRILDLRILEARFNQKQKGGTTNEETGELTIKKREGDCLQTDQACEAERPPKKRKMTITNVHASSPSSDLEQLTKREKRRQINRISAQFSRERKKQVLEELKNKNKELTLENEKLSLENAQLWELVNNYKLAIQAKENPQKVKE